MLEIEEKDGGKDGGVEYFIHATCVQILDSVGYAHSLLLLPLPYFPPRQNKYV